MRLGPPIPKRKIADQSAPATTDQGVLTDAAGHPVLSVSADGVRIHGLEGTAEVYETGTSGSREISIADYTGPTALTTSVSDGDCFNPHITGDRQAIRFLSDLRGTVQPFVMTPAGRNRITGSGRYYCSSMNDRQPAKKRPTWCRPELKMGTIVICRRRAWNHSVWSAMEKTWHHRYGQFSVNTIPTTGRQVIKPDRYVVQ